MKENGGQFAPGFRLSAMDVVILIIGAAASVAVGFYEVWLGAAIAFVVGHFFLFCNILRMSRPMELIWAAVFAGLAIATITRGMPSWLVTFCISAMVTVLLAIVESRRPWYHG